MKAREPTDSFVFLSAEDFGALSLEARHRYLQRASQELRRITDQLAAESALNRAIAAALLGARP